MGVAITRSASTTNSPCRSELAREEPEDATHIQTARVIVDVFREQARSYNGRGGHTICIHQQSPVGASLLAMSLRPPRTFRQHASSLTFFAGKPAPTLCVAITLSAPNTNPPVGAGLPAKKSQTAAYIQTARVIIDVLRQQAGSYRFSTNHSLKLLANGLFSLSRWVSSAQFGPRMV